MGSLTRESFLRVRIRAKQSAMDIAVIRCRSQTVRGSKKEATDRGDLFSAYFQRKSRSRRTHHLHDGSLGIAEECRPRSKGAAPSGTADLMQNLPRISKQFQPMQRIPTKKPTVQKSCIDRADPDFSGLHNKKERQILRFDVQNLVHLQGLEPWAH